MNYLINCIHYTDTNSRLRPYCLKLSREIRIKDCNITCGFYRKYQQPDMVDVNPELNRLLREHSRKELGLEEKTE